MEDCDCESVVYLDGPGTRHRWNWISKSGLRRAFLGLLKASMVLRLVAFCTCSVAL